MPKVGNFRKNKYSGKKNLEILRLLEKLFENIQTVLFNLVKLKKKKKKQAKIKH